MSLLGRYRQNPSDDRKRMADYRGALETTEIISDVDATVTPVTVPPLSVDNISVDEDGKKFAYYVSGGIDGEEYEINFAVQTSGGQTFNDQVGIEIEA